MYKQLESKKFTAFIIGILTLIIAMLSNATTYAEAITQLIQLIMVYVGVQGAVDLVNGKK